MINQENLQSFTKWSGIVAVFTIVLGALSCLTIIGAITGVFMIIAGVKLLNAKRAASELAGIEDPAIFNERLNTMMNESSSFLKFQGIYYIISVVLGVLGIIAYIGVIVAVIRNMPLY